MDRAELAGKWAEALAELEYVPREWDEIVAELLTVIDAAVQALAAPEFDRQRAVAAGAQLGGTGYREPICLQASVEMLGRGLPLLPELAEVPDRDTRLVAWLGGLSAGFADGARQMLFSQQEDIKKALTLAKEHSDARFREVFTSTAVGMAISQLDGKLVDANRALADILDHGSSGVPHGTVFDMFHPDDRAYLRQRYQELIGADVPRFREQRRLIGRDGEEKWAFISVSLFRLRDDVPRYHVTMVEDITDQHLLENRLSFQVLHDALTGLPNREHFLSQLETTVGRLQPTDMITVYHLALDNFTVVNDGLGRKVGDALLTRVAQRLRDVVADEKATVARLGGIEFAILVQQTPTTPSVAELAARINEELGEPVYLDGKGVAASASIGVVQAAAGEVDPIELMRIADVTLRRVKAKGRSQWGLADAEQDQAHIARYTLAATVHGAWENGEIGVRYQPQVLLDSGRITAVQARLQWDHPELGALDHHRCVEVVQDTGLVLAMGRWLLREAAATAATWRRQLGDEAPALAVDLAASHASDPDLVHNVRELLAEFGLPTRALRIGMPVSALCTLDGEAEDNLTTVVDLGVTSVLHGFGTTRGDLACLEDLPVHAVSMAERAIARVAGRGAEESLFSKSMRGLVDLVHGAGVAVLAPELDDDARVAWWRGAGADLGQGSRFGAPVTASDLTELLREPVAG